MSKIKSFFKNISPLNNRTEMPMILYVIKVVIIFWFVKFGAELIGEAVVIALHFACGKNPLQGEMFDLNTITLITHFGYGLMIGIIVLYWKLFQKKTIAELGFTKNAGTYFIGAVVGVVLILFSVVSVVLTGAITYNGTFTNINHIYIILMLGGFIFQGAFEEVLCRGVVLQLLKDRTPISVAVGVSSVLFMIPHLNSMVGASLGIYIFAVVNLILISLVFSFLTLQFKSIWAACGLHSIWNFILYNILGLNLSGQNEMTAAIFNMKSVGSNILNGGAYGIEASTITAVVLTVFLFICYTMIRTGEITRERQD